MFELDFGKLVVIGIIALIAIGPKELPAVLRTVGQWMTKVRRMAAEFQGQFQEAMREAEMADMKKHMDEINDAAKGLTSSFDPMATGLGETRSAAEDKPLAPPPQPDPVTADEAHSPAASLPPPAAAADLQPAPPAAEPALAAAEANPAVVPEARERPA